MWVLDGAIYLFRWSNFDHNFDFEHNYRFLAKIFDKTIIFD